jgi:hypothetical protein
MPTMNSTWQRISQFGVRIILAVLLALAAIVVIIKSWVVSSN